MPTKDTIPKTLDGCRLDKAVREILKVPWSRARTVIVRGKIFLDGEVCLDGAVQVAAGSTLVFVEDAPRPRGDGELDNRQIVHLDSHLLVAFKPAGVLTVPFEQGDRGTFDNQLRGYLAKLFPGHKRSGARPSLMVVHRLDRGTSGLLVFPRTFVAKEHLAEQFREHTVARTYTALVHGTATSKTIISHLVADRGDGIRGSVEHSWVKKIRNHKQGRESITHITVERELAGATLVTCKLETGRTNQIRIHLSEEGHPLVGETTYMRSYKGPRIKAPRLMLHAGELGFIHPATGETLQFSAPLPEAFNTAIAQLNPTSLNH
jgi:23S rRNA pseudouridine1911/1915/1917 synthase